MIEQLPTATNVTVVPVTVHTEGVEDAKLTGFPEFWPVAVSVTEPLPYTTLSSCVNVRVWLAGVIVKLFVTGVAAA